MRCGCRVHEVRALPESCISVVSTLWTRHHAAGSAGVLMVEISSAIELM